MLTSGCLTDNPASKTRKYIGYVIYASYSVRDCVLQNYGKIELSECSLVEDFTSDCSGADDDGKTY